MRGTTLRDCTFFPSMDATRRLKSHLQRIHDSIPYFQPLIARPPILDSSFEAANESNEEHQWPKQEGIPGLKKLKENIGIDLESLNKVLFSPHYYLFFFKS